MDPSDTETLQRDPNARQKLGPYTIVAPLGAGGMGVVYRAYDERLGREVAVKVVRPGLLADESARARFRKEALALARLNHPNIAVIHDVGIQDGSDYIVMEFVQGRTLRERLNEGPLSTKETLTIAAAIASALEEAHEQGVIHRDLKPGNIMVTAKGHVKILDFGLAKLVAQSDRDGVTQPLAETAGIVGTPLYMSPEQAEGRAVDERTDLWSLGVILYESFSGKAPFRGDSGLAILRAVTSEVPDPLRETRPDLPDDANHIVTRALQKDVSARYQSASEISHDLDLAIARLGAPAAHARSGVPRAYGIGAAIVIVALAGIGGWSYRTSARRRWAKEDAIPRAAALFKNDRPLAAYQLMNEAAEVLPADAQLADLAAKNIQSISIVSSPPGATVDVQDYFEPAKPWVRLGVTPLRNIRFPRGLFRWRVGGEPDVARFSRANVAFDLASRGATPPDMVHVGANTWADMIAFIGWIGPYDLPAYDIDRFEVTNREYQKFVDDGGYTKPEYWKEPLVPNGSAFRDRSGRPGPSTWDGGHYPEGKADYPVSGVSWYEASAYAAYAGKSLPVLAQWFQASPEYDAPFTVRLSNISRASLAAAGTFKGLGPYGTYDMVGNVREWVANATSNGERFILGGAWNAQSYLAVDPEALLPFDRSAENGFRCVRNSGRVPPEAAGPVKTLTRDFAAFKPASDDVFRVYRSMYEYDRTPLDATTETVVQDTADWREEKVSFNAAYGGERVTAYLFLPKRVRAPFQTVVFFPSARVLDIDNSSTLGDVKFFDYVVKSGRAVLYPVYKGTYERGHGAMPGTENDAELMRMRGKDVGRAIDYLRTRPDIDGNRLAYLGVSMGSAEGVIYTTIVQDALKTAVLLDGGFFLTEMRPGADQADFAPRLKIPVLMVNGRYDFTFSLMRAQEPLFRMLGTKPADKVHLVLEAPHDVTARRPELIAAVTGWLDKYLGPVR